MLRSLRLWVCSGEMLPVSLADQFFATFGDDSKILANFYGSTEIMGDVTYHLLTNRKQLQNTQKVPIGNWEIATFLKTKYDNRIRDE